MSGTGIFSVVEVVHVYAIVGFNFCCVCVVAVEPSDASSPRWVVLCMPLGCIGVFITFRPMSHMGNSLAETFKQSLRKSTFWTFAVTWFFTKSTTHQIEKSIEMSYRFFLNDAMDVIFMGKL